MHECIVNLIQLSARIQANDEAIAVYLSHLIQHMMAQNVIGTIRE
jgi:hypothetical protein